MPNNFEEFLQNKHAEQYTGTDDDMPDNFVDWSSNISYEDMIAYADEYKEAK